VTSIPVVSPSEFGIKVFPNPTGGRIFFRALKSLRDVNVRLIDMKGQTIFIGFYPAVNAGSVTEPIIPHLNGGTYILEFITREWKTSVKVIRE
jgi:hypothetical protein